MCWSSVAARASQLVLALLLLASARALCQVAPGAGWEDPEPAGAQELAEQVVDAEWNRDKVTRLEERTSTLRMAITRLVDRTTGIEGFRTSLATDETSVEDRLERLRAEKTATELTIRLSGAVLFDFDSASIRPDAEATLEDVVAVLAAYPGRPVRVEGHTDAVGSEAYNQQLSEERADAVAAWLSSHEIDGARLRTRGFGELRPVADNGSSQRRQANRRVEIVIETGR